MKPKLSDLWRWDGTIEHGTFLFWGMVLIAVKFNLDRLLAFGLLHSYWTIFDLEVVRLYLWQSLLHEEIGRAHV